MYIKLFSLFSIIDDFSEARRMSYKAEFQSDVQSEGEYGRGLRRYVVLLALYRVPTKLIEIQYQ